MKQFVVQGRRKDHWMAAAPLVERKDDWFSRFFEELNQLLNQIGANQRVIDQAEQDSARAGWQASQRRLNRGQLPPLPILIDHDFIRFEVDRFGNGLGVRTQHDSAHSDLRLRRYFQKMLKERPALVGEQRLWRAHSA